RLSSKLYHLASKGDSMTRKRDTTQSDSIRAQSAPSPSAPALPPQGPPPPPFPTNDIFPNGKNDTPFTNARDGYNSRSGRVRFVWTAASVRTQRKLLFQAAAQFPAYFFIFKQETSTNLSAITSGRVSPPVL